MAPLRVRTIFVLIAALAAHSVRSCIPLSAEDEAALPSRTCNIEYAVYGRLRSAVAPQDVPDWAAPAPGPLSYRGLGGSRRRKDDFEVIQMLRQPPNSEIQPGDMLQARCDILHAA